jgi:hypothetical protein
MARGYSLARFEGPRINGRSAKAMFTRVMPCIVLVLLCAGEASAQESAYCRRVRARAASDATLLMSPRLALQGLRFPQTGQVDAGITVGSGFQTRASMTFSPIDFYKGLGVLSEGAADCDEHQVSTEVEAALTLGNDGARLSALRSEASFLRDHRDEWRAVSDRAAARLSEHTITLVEFDSARQRVGELERKLSRAEGEAAEIEARGGPTASAPLSELTRRYAELASRAEQAEARLRRLEPWQVEMTGGVVAQTPIDWYGLVELSVNLGVFAHGRQEERHAEARMDEVHRAPYELEARVERLRAETAAVREAARQELGVVEHDLATLAGVRKALDGSDAANILHARDLVAVEELSAESDGVFLRAFIGSLGALLEDGHV